MSDYTSRATATFEVNGKQGEQELTKLRKKAEDLREALMNAWKTGDSTAQKGLQKELNKTERQIRKIQSEIVNVEQVLKRLDRATPKELQQTLRHLEKDLKNIERGSKAWDEQTKKIKAVRTELAKIKAETKEQTSLWERFAKKMFDWGAALQVVMAFVTGITMTARKAVEAYAQMEQEEANVRKYTGMTADEVSKLNDEFKKMDTRSSREQLNQLAQEAGRLGMQTQEDVLGFVRAADQINVALDELGEDATLTLSKLTDIFGDRQRLGVEKSLLSVGSVINELSQNSTAAAPYLAEFASRLGGVGAQAGMSIQQIMAFGAVLDSSNQKVESASTALSQLIVKLYRDPAKYAAAAGLEVKKFADLMKKDANEGVLTLLETLNKAGGMDVLAPMFADMGEKGARSVQTLATLAKHIDEVRAQQQVATQAFAEATSVTKEFNVQNNTVQAELDKAKKRFNEMAVELGQKLLPVMRFAITSSSAMMKVMSGLINYLVQHKQLIVNVTLAVVAYTIAVNAAAIAHKTWNIIEAAGNVLFKTGRVTVLAFTAAINLLTGNTLRATAAWRLLSAALKANPFGLLASAVTLAVVAFYRLGESMRSAQVKAMQAKKANDEYKKSLIDFSNQAEDSAKKEMAALDALYKVATNDLYTREKRIEAVKKLQNMYPAYFSNLSQEAIMAGNAADKYKSLVNAIYQTAMARAAAAKIEQNASEILDLQLKLDKQREDARQKDEAYRQARQRTHNVGPSARDLRSALKEENKAAQESTQASMAMGQTSMAIADRMRANEAIMKKVPDAAKYLTGGTSPGGAAVVGGFGTSGSDSDTKHGGSTGKTDKLAAEKAWREKEIALAKIAWLKGETDYKQHTDRLEQIDVEYAEKILERTDLTEQERLDAQAKYWEAKHKQDETAHARTIEEEEASYAERKAFIQQDYLDGLISRESYDLQMERAEMEHLYAMTQLTKNGTEERRRAEEAYRVKLVANQQKRQKEFEDNEKKHRERIGDIWQQYFVTDEEKKQEQYKLGLRALEDVYKQELKLAGSNAEAKLEIEKRYAEARKKLHDEIFKADKNSQKSWEDWIGNALDKVFGDGTWEKYGDTVKNAFASMTAMMQSFNQLAQAEAEIKLANLDKQYQSEISMAEGNNRKVKALERKKEQEEAKIKAEAQKKEFAQQVFSAISSTALAAINAYASASKINWLLGPVAAGLALAAGAVQIAAIKKQQEASTAKGYSIGGFTPDGPKDKPVGVVHAGEWVASQKLVQNPATRPAIEALEYAQRHNSFGALRASDVSRRVTAPSVIAGAAANDQSGRIMVAVAAALGDYGNTMKRLGERLDEPFVTVNTVTGDMGIKNAQDEYQRLMNNTLPKSKRK